MVRFAAPRKACPRSYPHRTCRADSSCFNSFQRFRTSCRRGLAPSASDKGHACWRALHFTQRQCWNVDKITQPSVSFVVPFPHPFVSTPRAVWWCHVPRSLTPLARHFTAQKKRANSLFCQWFLNRNSWFHAESQEHLPVQNPPKQFSMVNLTFRTIQTVAPFGLIHPPVARDAPNPGVKHPWGWWKIPSKSLVKLVLMSSMGRQRKKTNHWTHVVTFAAEMNFDDLHGCITLESWDHILKQEKLNALNHWHFPIHVVNDADSLMNDTNWLTSLVVQFNIALSIPSPPAWPAGLVLLWWRRPPLRPSDAMHGVLMSWVPLKPCTSSHKEFCWDKMLCPPKTHGTSKASIKYKCIWAKCKIPRFPVSSLESSHRIPPPSERVPKRQGTPYVLQVAFVWGLRGLTHCLSFGFRFVEDMPSDVKGGGLTQSFACTDDHMTRL